MMSCSWDSVLKKITNYKQQIIFKMFKYIKCSHNTVNTYEIIASVMLNRSLIFNKFKYITVPTQRVHDIAI